MTLEQIKTVSISDLLNKPKQQIVFAVERFGEMEESENIEFPHKHNFTKSFGSLMEQATGN
jgi:hypothetical protein